MSKKAGIINVFKPPGMTSFDVVDWLQKFPGVQKAGHTGTLDPRAAGVLPVCFNKATKIIQFLPRDKKEYRCLIELGIKTNTLDKEGEVLADSELPRLSREELEEILEKFRGEIEQLPPMYSAVKKDGKRLYELARSGEEVEREPREVTIKNLELIDFNPPCLTLDITCSPGTYIRSIARDIGEELDCGGILSFLIRNASGNFTLDSALTFPRIAEAEELDEIMIGLTEPLTYPELIVKKKEVEQAVNGNLLSEEAFEEVFSESGPYEKDQRFIIRGPEGMFISISRLSEDETGRVFKPERVFNLWS